MTLNLVQAIAGVSTVLGLLSLIAFLIYSANTERQIKSVERQLIDAGLINSDTLLNIPSADRGQALKHLLDAQLKSTTALLNKVNPIDVHRLNAANNRSAQNGLKRLSYSLLAIALIAVLYGIWTSSIASSPTDSCRSDNPPVSCFFREKS